MVAYDLIKLVGEENVREEESLSKHTTFRIGGPAKFFVTPESIEALEQVVHFVKLQKEPYVIFGNGSNLLVKDAGYQGVVISTHGKDSGRKEKDGFGLHTYQEMSLSELNGLLEKYTEESDAVQVDLDKRLIVAGSGILLSTLANGVAAKGLTGFEFASGIPGTLHRISAIRNRQGKVVGLTCRIGRVVTGTIACIKDIVLQNKSILFLGDRKSVV